VGGSTRCGRPARIRPGALPPRFATVLPSVRHCRESPNSLQREREEIARAPFAKSGRWLRSYHMMLWSVVHAEQRLQPVRSNDVPPLRYCRHCVRHCREWPSAARCGSLGRRGPAYAERMPPCGDCASSPNHPVRRASPSESACPSPNQPVRVSPSESESARPSQPVRVSPSESARPRPRAGAALKVEARGRTLCQNGCARLPRCGSDAFRLELHGCTGGRLRAGCRTRTSFNTMRYKAGILRRG
jgi:hypothetical protein